MFTVPGRRSKAHDNTIRTHRPSPLSQAPITYRDTVEGIDTTKLDKPVFKKPPKLVERVRSEYQDQTPSFVETTPVPKFKSYCDAVRGGKGGNRNANSAYETRASGSGQAIQDLHQGQCLETITSEYQINGIPGSSGSAFCDNKKPLYSAILNSHGKRYGSKNSLLEAETSSSSHVNENNIHHGRNRQTQSCLEVRQRHYDNTSLSIENVPPEFRDTVLSLIIKDGLAEQVRFKILNLMLALDMDHLKQISHYSILAD